MIAQDEDEDAAAALQAPAQSTRVQVTRAGISRIQFRSRGNVRLEDLTPAVAERIRGLQRQLAADIQTQQQRAAPEDGSQARSVLAYLPVEDNLLQLLRLSGVGYRQIVTVSNYHLYITPNP